MDEDLKNKLDELIGAVQNIVSSLQNVNEEKKSTPDTRSSLQKFFDDEVK